MSAVTAGRHAAKMDVAMDPAEPSVIRLNRHRADGTSDVSGGLVLAYLDRVLGLDLRYLVGKLRR